MIIIMMIMIMITDNATINTTHKLSHQSHTNPSDRGDTRPKDNK